MAVQVDYSGAWCFDIYAASTITASTTDLYEDAWVTTLGAFYRSLCVTPGIVIRRQLSHGGYGVDIPQEISGIRFTARIYDDAAGTYTTIFDRTLEWRNVRVRIRRFDFKANTVTSARFTGVITNAVFADGMVEFSFGSQIRTVLEKMIPAKVIDAADFPLATDLGAAIPVPYGRCVIRPPYIKLVDTASTTDPGGHDFLLGWGSATPGYGNVVIGLFDDVDKYQTGLDKLSGWVAAPGTPTYASASTFTVSTATLSNVYMIGTPIRCTTTASGTSYIYGFVSGVSSTTVTVSGTMTLDAGMANVKIGGEYLIYESTYTIDTVNINSIRLHSTPQGGLLADVVDQRIGGPGVPTSNPATVIGDVLSADADTYGLGETINSTTFDAAATALSTAGLGNAFNGALGWDGRQQRFIDFLADVLSWRGMRLIYDGANSRWDLYVDGTPSASGVTFGYHDGVYNNVKRVIGLTTTPANDAVKTLTLKYGRAGRRVGDRFREAQDFQYKTTAATVTGIGKDLIISSDYLGPRVSMVDLTPDHVPARRVLDYRSKRLRYSDQKATIEVGQEIHDVELGQTCTFIDVPDGIASSTWFIAGIEERLDGGTLVLWGHDAAVYTDTHTTATTAPTNANRDETVNSVGSAPNMLLNPDFLPLPPRSTIPDAANPLGDYTSLVGWNIHATTTQRLSITRTVDAATKGGAYITVVASGTEAELAASACGLAAVNTYEDPLVLVNSGYDIVSGQQYFFSWYSDTDGTGQEPRVLFFLGGTPVSSQKSRVYVASDDANAKGWKRLYMRCRAPASVDRCYPDLLFTLAGTYKIEGFQFERVHRLRPRPTEWTRSTTPYTTPYQMGTGDLPIRPDINDPEGGTVIRVRKSADTTLSGASTNVLGEDGQPLIPAGSIPLGVTGRTKTNITYAGGGTAFNVGTPTDPDWWGAALTKNTAADRFGAGITAITGGAAGKVFNAATHVQLTPDAGTFSAGAVKLLYHYIDLVSPSVE